MRKTDNPVEMDQNEIINAEDCNQNTIVMLDQEDTSLLLNKEIITSIISGFLHRMKVAILMKTRYDRLLHHLSLSLLHFS